MPSDITVYSKPNCVQCDATVRKLDQLGATYVKVDVTEDIEALETIRAIGYSQAPVVVAGEDHWSGYRPHRIEELVADAQEAVES
ncbi:glutaredoxin-like protein NrdH [Nocardia xishanensis]|uniref:glutaredoxin-like protein NrdH n=1 Tax=Nocardia xishanensis TaxID=238964 RepID=UPI000836699B|nr:glutaredoxin-like protein NrdH [Nocardia xishanensis]